MTRHNDATTDMQLDTKTMEGIDKHFSSTSTLPLGGTAMTPAQVKAIYQADIDAQNALDAARSQVKELVTKKKQTRAAARANRKLLKAYVVGTLGAQAVVVLEDLGIQPPKPPGRKKVQAKAQAIAQSKATRALRHTMGSRQKRAIKAPPPAPPAPPAPQPATAPPSPAAPASAAPLAKPTA
jgi:hypothetical protein